MSTATDYSVKSSSTSTPSPRQSQVPIISRSSRAQSFTPKTWTSGESLRTTRRHRYDSFSSDRDSSSKKKSEGGYTIRSSDSSSSGVPGGIISPRDEWWDHVLPPGQLAERLRKAQGSSSSINLVTTMNTSSPTYTEEVPKSSRKSILRNATPSERKTWTSFSDFGKEKAQSIRSSGGNSTRSSVGSLPSIRSDISSISATSSSSAEDSNIDAFSPSVKEESSPILYDRSTTASPTLIPSIHRSTSLRRSRVFGDTNDSSSNSGIGLGLGVSKASEVDERLRQWHFDATPAAPHNSLLRPFPSTAGGRQSPLHVLEDTPEVSSEEEAGLKGESISTSSTTMTRTIRRSNMTTSSVRTLDSLFDGQPSSDVRQDVPITSARRQSWQNPADRHVSFTGQQNESWQKQTIGRAASGRVQSMLNDSNRQKQARQPDSSRRNTKVFPSSASSETVKMHTAPPPTMHYRDRRRTTCYSAPTSPQIALNSLHTDKPFPRATAASHRKQAKEVNSYDPDLALYSSTFGQAQNRMSSAGSLALTLTRQLSVPLRPMLQLTMFLSISSFTFMALAGFLIAGYLITVFDDVNHRGKQIQSSVNIVTKKMEASLQWCERIVTPSRSPPTRSPSSMVTAPIRFAFAVPTTIAYKLTPTSVSESFGFGDNAAAPAVPSSSSSQQRSSSPRPASQSSQSSKSSSSSIPPRPPLSSLLPSIFLTIMIALGAGLASFFAGRFPTSTSTSSAAFATTTAPLSPPAMPPRASSHIPIRKRHTMQTDPRRHSYDFTTV